MNKHLLFSGGILLAAGLGAGCSKGPDLRAAASIKSFVTYTLDGRTMSGTAKVSLKPASGTGGVDSLFLNTYAQTSMGAEEYIHLAFYKLASQSDIQYKLATIYINLANSTSFYFDSPHAATLTQTSPGKWAGTFAGSRVDKLGRVLGSVTNGVFTEIAQ
ncbi:hypothetical protein HHL22_20215 [Hymenobacter sp. RP-2-7]|uniref:Uncharacterized protein n=1 Tax=Hymenobacter polaris TaxID=2682546 RepID=A0A7Y0AHM4_9BACT|nr:hypothetical protein [Hymenobacter polaris]NML67533.1 hypothetical protein [Hymenobacter polaris]